MSRYDENQPEECGSKKAINKKICLTILIFLLVSPAALVWFILRPSKPHFALKEADLNQLTISTPSLLNSSIQLTLQSHNLSNKVRLYYDQLILYASYKGQKITYETAISPFYQGERETTTLTASLAGSQQPVSPSLAYEVERDHSAGRMALSFRAMGSLRWKVGPFVSRRYRFVVNCDAVMPIGVPFPSPPLRSTQGSQCSNTM